MNEMSEYYQSLRENKPKRSRVLKARKTRWTLVYEVGSTTQVLMENKPYAMCEQAKKDAKLTGNYNIGKFTIR